MIEIAKMATTPGEVLRLVKLGALRATGAFGGLLVQPCVFV